MDQIERVEVDVRLKGMQLRLLESLYGEIEKIKQDTEIAVKKAIENYDFDGQIQYIIHKWLDEKLSDISVNSLDSEMFNIEPELTRLIKNKIKKSLDEEDNKQEKV